MVREIRSAKGRESMTATQFLEFKANAEALTKLARSLQSELALYVRRGFGALTNDELESLAADHERFAALIRGCIK
jgi:hypothetical protein